MEKKILIGVSAAAVLVLGGFAAVVGYHASEINKEANLVKNSQTKINKLLASKAMTSTHLVRDYGIKASDKETQEYRGYMRKVVTSTRGFDAEKSVAKRATRLEEKNSNVNKAINVLQREHHAASFVKANNTMKQLQSIDEKIDNEKKTYSKNVKALNSKISKYKFASKFTQKDKVATPKLTNEALIPSAIPDFSLASIGQ